jgi:hypothetical protein
VIRLANELDVPVILAALKAFKERSMSLHAKYADVAVAERNLYVAMSEHCIWMADGYCIWVSVGGTWFSDRKFLIEETILRVKPCTEHVSYAVGALDIIAKNFGCVAIVAGDTQIGHMTPHYHNAGFVTLGTQLMKEVPYGCSSEMDGG